MSDKTALGISEELRQFIEALVEEVVLEGKTFEEHKKYLSRFCQTESVDYHQLETNLSDLYETAEELKNHESKGSERLLRLLARECYLSQTETESILSAISKRRSEMEAKRQAEEEAKGRAEEEARRKRDAEKRAEAERKAREDAERKAQEEMKKAREEVERERKAREEAEHRAREERERKVREVAERYGMYAIDLGLPSGTKWASCNIGANRATEYGNLYAWGATEDAADIELSLLHWKVKDLPAICGTELDTAMWKCGSKWRMPTKRQFKELKDHCSYEWITLSGVNGGKFTGPNGNWIFLPASGETFLMDRRWNYTNDTKISIDRRGDEGHYWSVTKANEKEAFAASFRKDFLNFDFHFPEPFTCGYSIRPVLV